MHENDIAKCKVLTIKASIDGRFDDPEIAIQYKLSVEQEWYTADKPSIKRKESMVFKTKEDLIKWLLNEKEDEE